MDPLKVWEPGHDEFKTNFPVAIWRMDCGWSGMLLLGIQVDLGCGDRSVKKKKKVCDLQSYLNGTLKRNDSMLYVVGKK